MEFEHPCDGLECWQVKPRANLDLWVASDEELDTGDLVHYNGITDITSETAKLVCILDIVKKPCDLALLYKWS